MSQNRCVQPHVRKHGPNAGTREMCSFAELINGSVSRDPAHASLFLETKLSTLAAPRFTEFPSPVDSMSCKTSSYEPYEAIAAKWRQTGLARGAVDLPSESEPESDSDFAPRPRPVFAPAYSYEFWGGYERLTLNKIKNLSYDALKFVASIIHLTAYAIYAIVCYIFAFSRLFLVVMLILWIFFFCPYYVRLGRQIASTPYISPPAVVVKHISMWYDLVGNGAAGAVQSVIDRAVGRAVDAAVQVPACEWPENFTKITAFASPTACVCPEPTKSEDSTMSTPLAQFTRSTKSTPLTESTRSTKRTLLTAEPVLTVSSSLYTRVSPTSIDTLTVTTDLVNAELTSRYLSHTLKRFNIFRYSSTDSVLKNIEALTFEIRQKSRLIDLGVNTTFFRDDRKQLHYQTKEFGLRAMSMHWYVRDLIRKMINNTRVLSDADFIAAIQHELRGTAGGQKSWFGPKKITRRGNDLLELASKQRDAIDAQLSAVNVAKSSIYAEEIQYTSHVENQLAWLRSRKNEAQGTHHGAERQPLLTKFDAGWDIGVEVAVKKRKAQVEELGMMLQDVQERFAGFFRETTALAQAVDDLEAKLRAEGERFRILGDSKQYRKALEEVFRVLE